MKADTPQGDKAFGWQGLSVRTPADWDLGAFGGDKREGHAFLDDGMAVRLRLRWGQGRAGAVESSLKRFRRGFGRSNSFPGFSELPEESLPVRFRNDKILRAFRWDGGVGAVWRCSVCGRVVSAEVTPETGNSAAKEARNLVASIACHPDQDECLWSVYGFAFRLPSSYNLTQAGLEAGRLVFPFRHGADGWLTVERWATASHLLAKAPLGRFPNEWLKLEGWSARDAHCRDDRVRNAPGVRFEADARRRGGWFKRTAREERVTGMIWHDAHADKLVVIAAGGKAEALLDTVAQSVEYA